MCTLHLGQRGLSSRDGVERMTKEGGKPVCTFLTGHYTLSGWVAEWLSGWEAKWLSGWDIALCSTSRPWWWRSTAKFWDCVDTVSTDYRSLKSLSTLILQTCHLIQSCGLLLTNKHPFPELNKVYNLEPASIQWRSELLRQQPRLVSKVWQYWNCHVDHFTVNWHESWIVRIK